MFKYYFEQIENIERGPVVSLIIFFTFFIALLIWIWKMDKKYVEKMKNMPLDNNEEISIQNKE